MTEHLPGAIGRLYSTHESLFKDAGLACGPGCSVCCTDRVIATTLEARAIFRHLKDGGHEDLLARALAATGRDIYRPTATVNALARMCMERKEPPGEPEAEVSVCPLLDGGLCTVYELRPLACRAQMSETACRHGGEAVMDELSVTLNQVFFQAAEHLDQGGLTGNLMDLLAFLSGGPALRLQKNEPVPGLLVPAGHFGRARTLLHELLEVKP
ncbi:MAG: hypothetical protein AB1921_11995 [Thermodesulfobacteriota bacterium]